MVVGYRGRALLPPISASLQPGQLWALIGRNGSGKSTLLKTLVGQLAPVSGLLRWAAGVRLSTVAQRHDDERAVPARVLDVVRSGLDRGWSFLDPTWAWRHRERARSALEVTGAGPLAHQRFSELSEGQRQRVLLARALAGRATCLLLDEPTSALDAVAERDAFELVARLCSEERLTVLLASHHMGHVAGHATHAIFVDREAGIAVAGPWKEVTQNPAFQRDYGVTA